MIKIKHQIAVNINKYVIIEQISYVMTQILITYFEEKVLINNL